jgi:hypothetical protein
MWQWILDFYPDSNIFEGIGFWINLDKGIFQVNELANLLVKTLTKTDGYLNWDIGLRENIVQLAKESPEAAIEIIRLYMLEGGVRNKRNSLYFYLDEKWIEAFKILYKNPSTKLITDHLINDLIHEGGRYFWILKDVRN